MQSPSLGARVTPSDKSITNKELEEIIPTSDSYEIYDFVVVVDGEVCCRVLQGLRATPLWPLEARVWRMKGQRDKKGV